MNPNKKIRLTLTVDELFTLRDALEYGRQAHMHHLHVKVYKDYHDSYVMLNEKIRDILAAND